MKIKLDQVRCERNRELSNDDINRMAVSIGNVGLLNAITLMSVEDKVFKYEVIAGRRRFLALQTLQRKELDPHEFNLLDPDDPQLISYVENAERRQLTLTEEVEQLTALREHHDVSEIASLLGRSEKYIRLRLQLNNLTAAWMNALINERYPSMKVGHYEAISRFPESVQNEFKTDYRFNYLLNNPGSVAKFTENLNSGFCRLLNTAVFDTEKCQDCPKRSLAEPWLFEELKDPALDRCLDTNCWDKKTKARIISEAKDIRADENIKCIGKGYTGADRSLEALVNADRVNFEILEENVPREKANAFIVAGDNKGTYCRIRENDHESSSSASQPVTVEDKYEKLEKRRQKRALEKLYELLLNTELPEPKLEVLIRLIALQGVDSIASWQNDALFGVGIANLDAAMVADYKAIKKQLWKNIQCCLGHTVKVMSEARLADINTFGAEQICKVFNLNWQEYLDSAIEEIQEPASWNEQKGLLK